MKYVFYIKAYNSLCSELHAYIIYIKFTAFTETCDVNLYKTVK
jgi:hypothetical protein